MTTESTSRSSGRRRVVATGALCGLAVVAIACGSSRTEDTDVEVVEERVEAVARGQEATGFDDLEFGDTLDEVDHLGRTEAEPVSVAIPGFELVDWEDLIPPGFSSDEVLARYEERLTEAEPGSPELDALYEEMNAEFDAASVNEELDSQKVQLAGFVAPLTYDGDQITEFLLVPYFGACIHVPPPPANQTVMVTLADGESLSLEESWGAVWVAGEMSATTTDTELATAGYAISGPAFGVYTSQ